MIWHSFHSYGRYSRQGRVTFLIQVHFRHEEESCLCILLILLKIVHKTINIYIMCWICLCADADWHQCRHQAADAARCGFPFAWGSHAGITEVQGQEAQLRPAGKLTTRVVNVAEIQYIHHMFPKKCCCAYSVGLKKRSVEQTGTDPVVLSSITVTLLIQVQLV